MMLIPANRSRRKIVEKALETSHKPSEGAGSSPASIAKQTTVFDMLPFSA